ncbi:hypothetical protein [Streptomyces sp. SS]|uniref:hypothetical protein n=1 Tax=Streptomyces sp. SS TaxID=260742 RepID=UPI00035D8FFC
MAPRSKQIFGEFLVLGVDRGAVAESVELDHAGREFEAVLGGVGPEGGEDLGGLLAGERLGLAGRRASTDWTAYLEARRSSSRAT